MKRALLTAIIIYSHFASAEFKCVDANIKILNSGKLSETNRKVCHNNEKNIFLSQNCLLEKCAILTDFKKTDFTNYQIFSSYSNPGFKLCEEIGSTAAIATYFFSGGQQIQSDICENAKDKSFSNSANLVDKLLKQKR